MLILNNKIMIFAIIFFTLIIIIFIISNYECKRYKISTFNVKNIKNSKKLRLIFISDFHNKYYKNNYDNIINDILNTKPDYIILGGDFIDFSKFQSLNNKIGISNTYSFIKELIEKIDNNKNYNLKGIFFSFGNHELRLKSRIDNVDLVNEYSNFIEFIKNNNIKLLDNNIYKLDEGINLSGLSLFDGYYRNVFSRKTKYTHIENKVLNNYFKNIDKNDYNIIAFHKPDYATDLIDYGFDLVLSGHYHGGLINFPIIGPVFSPDFKPFPKYSIGKYEYRDGNIIVSAGLGEHFLKIRVNNIPEIVEININ
ncbi:MAG: metallophosphoesterase [Lachnospiraceae bacterium]|nr:metallophosphoesterase [Lachnospiraceae bacterium]